MKVKQPIGNVSSQIRMEEATRKDSKGGKAEKGQAGQKTHFQVSLLGPNALQAEVSIKIFRFERIRRSR